MIFDEWANRTFGSHFVDEEPITYFRMSSAWEAGAMELKQQRDELLEMLKLAQQIIGHPDDAHSKMIAKAIANAEASQE